MGRPAKRAKSPRLEMEAPFERSPSRGRLDRDALVLLAPCSRVADQLAPNGQTAALAETCCGSQSTLQCYLSQTGHRRWNHRFHTAPECSARWKTEAYHILQSARLESNGSRPQ